MIFSQKSGVPDVRFRIQNHRSLVSIMRSQNSEEAINFVYS